MSLIKDSIARAGLFDRLVDQDPNSSGDARSKQTFNEEELRNSVLQELERLLNTRSPVSRDQLESGGRSVIDYGVPDYTTWYVKSVDDQTRLARFMKEAITFYEPRLKAVKVSFVREKNEKSIIMQIKADFVTGPIQGPVLFPVVVEQSSGQVKLYVE